jgi:hypothetical protein
VVESRPLRDAFTSCKDIHMVQHVRLADAGHTIIVNTHSENGSVKGVGCVLAILDTPKSIMSRVSSTNALMGSQHATADGLRYDWSYHPDNGLQMVITD